MHADYGEQIKRRLAEALESEIEDIRKQVLAEAHEAFVERAKAAVARVAVDVSNYFAVDRFGDDLRITCTLKKGDENPWAKN